MDYEFRIIPNNDLDQIIPLLYDLNEGKIEKKLLQHRINEMRHQNYECAGAFHNKVLVGISGLWFSTRHYIGKSVELDHVFINPEARSKGLGKKFMLWVNNYVANQGCKSIELNTYVQNYPSHKFYYNQGFEILGYHFLKKL